MLDQTESFIDGEALNDEAVQQNDVKPTQPVWAEICTIAMGKAELSGETSAQKLYEIFNREIDEQLEAGGQEHASSLRMVAYEELSGPSKWKFGGAGFTGDFFKTGAVTGSRYLARQY